MEEYTNRELGIVLENLTKSLEEGFAGVHKRQDTTNGKVLGNRKWIDENRQLIEDLKNDRENKFRRYSDIIWKIAQVATLIALGFKVL